MSPSPSSAISRTGACQRCHKRKIKCNRSRPSCTACSRVNTSCIYAAREHQVQLRRHDVEKLEQRVRQLQAENDALTARSNSEARSSPQNDAATLAAPSLLGLGFHQQRAENGHHNRAPPANGDIANQVIHLSLSAGGGRNFVGSTSGLFLANLIQPQGQPSAPLLQGSQASQGSTGAGPAAQGMAQAGLPPREVATEIIDAYLNHDRLPYPFIPRKTLDETIKAIYDRPQSAGPLHSFQIFLFNMILAIGTAQVYKLNWNSIWDAEMSYTRATAHLVDTLAQGGVTALQALLLVCQYRMSTPSHDSTTSVWHLIGVAARMCFELGLHRASTYATPRPTEGPSGLSTAELEAKREELETKRCCFWSVVCMDRVASLVLGRPMAIQMDDVDAELPVVDQSILDNATSPVSLSSPSNAGTGMAAESIRRHFSTAIFVHIVKYRIICGKILNVLHRHTAANKDPSVDYEAARTHLKGELQSWYASMSDLPLIPAEEAPASPAGRSSFRSREWYDLLYHNGILMLYRPSPCLCDTSRNSAALQHLFDSSQRSLTLYAHLHRTGRINYSWVTLHSIFMVGLSYVYALRTHLQHARSQTSSHNGSRSSKNNSSGHASSHPNKSLLTSTPTITQVVNDTRACSKVLVAVSERWAVARNCSEVFDKLSDAVVADVVDAQTGGVNVGPAAHSAAPTASMTSTRGMTRLRDGGDSQVSASGTAIPAAELSQESVEAEQEPEEPLNMTVDDTLRDCYEDLQTICYDQYHSDAIAQLSQEWLFGLADNPEALLF